MDPCCLEVSSQPLICADSRAIELYLYVNLKKLFFYCFGSADYTFVFQLESSSKVSSHLQAEPRMAREHSIPLAQLPGMSLISIYALAVGEENAAGHRVVTAPTNGACGIIPAVIKYSLKELILKNFHGVAPRLKYESVEHATVQAPRDFLLTAALVGMLYKHNASISGAESGCQVWILRVQLSWPIPYNIALCCMVSIK